MIVWIEDKHVLLCHFRERIVRIDNRVDKLRVSRVGRVATDMLSLTKIEVIFQLSGRRSKLIILLRALIVHHISITVLMGKELMVCHDSRSIIDAEARRWVHHARSRFMCETSAKRICIVQQLRIQLIVQFAYSCHGKVLVNFLLRGLTAQARRSCFL